MDTTTDIDVLLSAPDAEHVVRDDADWFVAGVPHAALRALVTESPDLGTVRRRLPAVAEDAVLLRVAPGSDRPLVAYRSVTASRSLYVCRSSAGRLLLTDCFRNAVAALDPEDRRTPDAAVADHLLFRAPVDPLTYLDRVRALERGTWVEWSPGSAHAPDGTTGFLDFDATPRPGVSGAPLGSLSVTADRSPGEVLDAVDRALADTLSSAGGLSPTDGADADSGALTTALSGGVDSTLVHSYLPDATPTLTWGVDSPEFAFELDYASAAADALGADNRSVVVSEGSFADRLAASVEATCLPTHYAQTTLMDAALRRAGGGRLVDATKADALFGLGGTKGACLASWLSSVVDSPVGRLAAALPGRPGDDAAALRRYAGMLRRPPTDPDSFPVRTLTYADPGRVARMVGESVVADRINARHAAVSRLVDRSERTSGFVDAAELAHLYCLFGHDHLRHWRQLAAVHDTALVAPFATRRLADCALSVPASRRYVPGPRTALSRRSLRPKYLLKTLLERRLPGYPTERPKGSGALPVGRYFDEGPLADAFDRYDLPTVVPRPERDRVVDGDAPVAWNLLTYAVWRDRVLENPDVERVPGTRSHSWSLRATA
ncbi:asparagine synthase-related protein [Halobium salinum]|uniref:Asparagine synthase-related protein n=1 Tax=Halobium salinum TaxID=1364940 RepID=A0ABD5PB98_9EURY|nr:asparagine synthase-related protein [Halobium salinum]